MNLKSILTTALRGIAVTALTVGAVAALSVGTAGSAGAATAPVPAAVAAAGRATYTVQDFCDYDYFSQDVLYGKAAAGVTGFLSGCKHTVYTNGVKQCSYVTVDKIWTRYYNFDLRVFLQRSGSYWRPLSVQAPVWGAGSPCAGQYVRATVTYGADLKLVRSFARDLWASPRVTLTIDNRQTFAENLLYFQASGQWTFWTR